MKKRLLSIILTAAVMIGMLVLPCNAATAEQESNTLTVNLRDAQFGYFDGFTEQRVFHVGDTFKVYTFLDLSKATEIGVCSWQSHQSYNTEMLELQIEDYTTCFPVTALAVYPHAVEDYVVSNINGYGFDGDNVYAIYSNYSSTRESVIFDDHTDILTVYTYKVIAPGETTIRNCVDAVGLNDKVVTPVIKYFYGPYNHEWDLGEVLIDGVYLHSSFTNPPQTKPVEPATEEPTTVPTEPSTEPTQPTEPDPSLNGLVDGYYYESGELAKGKGLVEFDGDIYFVKNDGSIYTNGTLKVAEAKTNGLLPAGNYTFNAEGKRVSDGLVDGYFYVNGKKAPGAGVVEFNGCFYFVKNDGSVYTSGRLSISEAKTNGLLPAAAYNINEDGKILCNGAINGYFYIDGDKAKGAGVVSYGKALYFVKNDGTFYKNGRLQIKEAKTNGLVAAGAYNFDADGKMQDVQRIIKGYYYLNGQKVKGAGLIEYKGDLYFVKRDASIYKSGTLLVKEESANGLVPEGRYTFDADGKMIR